MGFILRQSAKFSVLNVFLIGIGALSILFIYPNNLQLYGELNLFYFSANLITPLISLGFSNAILKYYQKFVNLQQDASYLSFSVLGTLIAGCFGFLIFLGLKDWIIQLLIFFNIPSGFISTHYLYIGILSLLVVLNSSLVYYSSIQRRIVVPELITNGGYKLFVPILILVSTFLQLSTQMFFLITLIYFIAVFIALFFYCYTLQPNKWAPQFKVFSAGESLDLIRFILLSSVNNFFYHLIFKFDIIVIGIYLSPQLAGVYAIVVFIISFMELPNKSVTQITTPLVSKYVADSNWAELSKLYGLSSQNLFLLGSFIYFLIIYNISYLNLFIPRLELSNDIILGMIFIGLSRLIDMTFSLNSQILLFSKRYYVYNLITVVIGTINLLLSQLWVKTYGLVGVAASVFLGVTLFNLLKSYYIWRKMGMNPLNKKMLYVFLLVIVLHLVWIVNPGIESPVLGLVVQSFGITLIFGIFVYKVKPSAIVNDFISEMAGKYWKKSENS